MIGSTSVVSVVAQRAEISMNHGHLVRLIWEHHLGTSLYPRPAGNRESAEKSEQLTNDQLAYLNLPSLKYHRHRGMTYQLLHNY